MELAALLWLVNDLTHSPLMLTIVGSCRYIPMMFFPVLGGMVADKMDRRRLLIGALLLAASLSIVLAILVKTGIVAIWHIIILSLLGGCHKFQSSRTTVYGPQPGKKGTPSECHFTG